MISPATAHITNDVRCACDRPHVSTDMAKAFEHRVDPEQPLFEVDAIWMCGHAGCSYRTASTYLVVMHLSDHA